ncbi:hypothetical protein J7355_17030 [Endozoicomonas sp. G2_2]|uniref:helicase-related protein n=1 Tax=Endozoicomonas sp. G2_2 TaxID=2821092 RepID=UPI001ADD51DD|nr:helicase-related protein [Endozoicomonas sp. G2_2]MBO9471798.1 hypothetical protein [Endozoicomonas sp. G2_2]
MIPGDYEVIPAALTSLKGLDLAVALRKSAGDGDTLALCGRFECPDITDEQWRPRIVDHHGHHVSVTISFDTPGLRKVFAKLHDKRASFFGPVYRQGRDWHIHDPEPMAASRTGQPRPVYDIHHMTRSSLAREHLDDVGGSYLEQAKLHNEFIREVRSPESFRSYLSASAKRLLDRGLKDQVSRRVALGDPSIANARESIRALLTTIHFPASQEELDAALTRVDRVAAVAVRASDVREAVKARRRHMRLKPQGNIFRPDPRYTTVEGLTELAVNMPFSPTSEQYAAVAEIVVDMCEGPVMRRVLSGDVGTGKTVIYALTAAAVAASGGTVGVMAPRQLLAKQNYDKLKAWLPGHAIGLVTGEGRSGDPEAKIWVGTQAVAGLGKTLDAVLVDEQQLMSKEQRESPAGATGHLLEGTATCIPRTTALAQSGEWAVTRLSQTHVEKTFEHRLLMPAQRGQLVADLRQAIEQGQTMLVVYPRLNKGAVLKDGTVAPALRESIDVWERLFPGKVVYAHGGDQAQQLENDAAIAAIRRGDAQILVGTAILEVGIDLPSAERIVVVQPDRFGMSQLHQLRGRVARAGGTGYCDLLLLEEPSGPLHKRLSYFCRITDGFVLAERDLLIRGGGDTTSEGHVQSGKAPKSPFENHELSSEILPEITAELEQEYWAEFDRKSRAADRSQ